jgi:hypothetical protein
MVRISVILLIFCGCAISPQHPHTSAHVTVHERKYYFDNAAPSQIALQSAVDRAISGDNAKLAYIISLEQFSDGESALNFGDLLLQIRDAVGLARFQSAIATLPAPCEKVPTGV